MLGTSEQTAKISKTGFTKFGHTAVSKPQWVWFSSKKTGCDKFESWGKKFHILAWAIFTRTTHSPSFFPCQPLIQRVIEDKS